MVAALAEGAVTVVASEMWDDDINIALNHNFYKTTVQRLSVDTTTTHFTTFTHSGVLLWPPVPNMAPDKTK
jgi:hypothetical protein